MRGFLSFILKHHFTLIFFLLQSISLVFIVSFNHTQREVFINSSNFFSGKINSKVTEVSSYFSLSEENKKLVLENSFLRNQLLKYYKPIRLNFSEVKDTLFFQNYSFLSAKVIQSSVHKTRNFLTIDAGRLQGVNVGNGVISSDGVVGVVKAVSKNYSVVLPIINSDFRVSCRIKKNQYYGSLYWLGGDYKTAILSDIPFHATIHKGDSLFTSGFSSIFPTGEWVGCINHFEKMPGENFYNITVDLSVDFKRIESVYVVNHLMKSELDSLKMGLDD